ncbi:MAG TPA: hypothetical protein VGC41_06230 [Kofleriaceae bacterium]
MSDIANFMVGGLMLGSFAIGAGRKMLERRRARRVLRARPTLGTETEEGTVVRVTGVVRARGEQLVAPISGKPCVVYRSRVMSAGGLVRRAFMPQESFAMATFVLERDEDQRQIEIEGEHALLDLPNLKLPTPRTSADHERRDRFLVLHNIRSNAGGVFEEVIVEDGMRVSIAGLMMKDIGEPDEGEVGYREGGQETLRLAGNREHPVIIGEP